MLKIKLSWNDGESIWRSSDAPTSIPISLSAWVMGAPKVTKNIKPYQLAMPISSGPSNQGYQTSTIHGRSCYLGSDIEGYNYFAKGIGWVLTDGWKPSFENLGIFPLWAAIRERDIAISIKNNGLDAVQPIAIIKHKSIPFAKSGLNTYISADQIKDLDQSNANPVMYIYRAKSRWRLADLFYLPKNLINSLLVSEGGALYWFDQIIFLLSRSVATVHKNKGHDHTLSLHNVFISGERVDFEYVVANGILHADQNLNQHQDIWRIKELFSLKVMAWELNEFLGLNYSEDKIDFMITSAYKDICDDPLPY